MGEKILLGVFGVGCILFVAQILTQNKVVHFVSRGGIGGILMMIMNCLLPQCVVGINLYTIVFSAILGIPGVMTLYVIKMMC